MRAKKIRKIRKKLTDKKWLERELNGWKKEKEYEYKESMCDNEFSCCNDAQIKFNKRYWEKRLEFIDKKIAQCKRLLTNLENE